MNVSDLVLDFRSIGRTLAGSFVMGLQMMTPAERAAFVADMRAMYPPRRVRPSRGYRRHLRRAKAARQ